VINPVILSSGGTIFYGRQNTNGGSIWKPSTFDGSGETYITTGARRALEGRPLSGLFTRHERLP